jgi:TRAP-type uncharacterized transport system substrate-binding protein
MKLTMISALLSLSMNCAFALNDSYVVAKSLPGQYTKISGALEYNYRGRYYLEGAGHYYGGHGLYIDPFAFNEHEGEMINDFPMKNWIKKLPEYLAYKVLKNYERIEGGVELSKEANSTLINSVEYKFIKRHFKQNVTDIKVGDVFFGPKKRYSTQNQHLEKCKINFGAILEVDKVDNKEATVRVANTYHTAQDIMSLDGCSTGSLIVIPIKKLRKFNPQFIVEAYKRNFLHQNMIVSLMGEEKFIEKKDHHIQFCSGANSGYYHYVVEELADKVSDRVQNVNTNGSLENLVNVKRRLCDYSLVQGDVYTGYEDKFGEPLQLTVIDKSVYKEKAFFVCSKKSKIFSSKDLNASNTILIGSKTSGSAFSYTNLKSVLRNVNSSSKNLLKVRTRNVSGRDAIKEIIKNNGEADCLFTVTRSESALIKEVLRNKRRLRLVSLELPYSKILDHYSTETISDESLSPLIGNGRTIRTIGIDVMVLAHKWSSKRHQRFEKEIQDSLKQFKRNRR